MRINRISYVIIASSLALIALIALQVKWMMDSRSLIEAQFDQKVRMALCYAVDNAKVETLTCSDSPVGCAPLGCEEAGFQVAWRSPVDMTYLDSALTTAFEFYDINLDYRMRVYEESRQSPLNLFNPVPAYTCALNPMEKTDSHFVSIIFPTKQSYIFGKMKFMFFSSILILFFITAVFVFANYSLHRQKRMNQINKEFFNNMAHEFRTPLTNISLASNLIDKKTQDDFPKKYLHIIKEENQKLQHQIERVLHLAKMENGKYQLEKEKLCPKQLLEQVIEGMDIQIKDKNAKIMLQSTVEAVVLEGDKFHLSNAFRNLLDNSLKYSSGNPEVNITMEKADEGILIHFEDNGIGIRKKDQKEVFNKFQRVDNGDVHNQKGFGIGLAYVKMIVERHQGFIKIFSDFNKGTRFDLFLPTV